MLSSKARGNVPPDTLHALAASHIEKFKAAYGTEHMKPKHHDEFHIGDNAGKLDGAMDCFAQERKGAAVKAGTEAVDNTRRFEYNTLVHVLHTELRALSDAALWRDGLRGRTFDYPELAQAHVADQCAIANGIYWRYMFYGHGDVVFIDGSPCKITCCAHFVLADEQRFALLVIPLTHEERVTATASRWRLRTELADNIAFLCGSSVVRHAVLWDVEDATHLLVVTR